MSRLFERPYSEQTERPVRLRLWRILNATLFPLVPQRIRIRMLKLFGAQLDGYLVVAPSVRIYAPWNLCVQRPWVVLGPRVEVYNKAKVTLGGHAIVSQDSYLCTASHDVASTVMALVKRPIVIGADSWVASHAIVLPGVVIGEGAVIGCGSVVTKDVATWTVVGGNPARFIKKRELILS